MNPTRPIRARVLVVILGATVVMVFGGWTVNQGPKTAEESVPQLREIGRRIATAVLNRDLETLLTYDRADLRAEDRVSLQDPKSYLSCFLFDRTCREYRRPSTYDILSSARRLDIEVWVLRGGKLPPSGWLLFFDASRLSKSQLRSVSFRCRHTSQIASWMFKCEDGAWASDHPMFDFETDTLCSPN